MIRLPNADIYPRRRSANLPAMQDDVIDLGRKRVLTELAASWKGLGPHEAEHLYQKEIGELEKHLASQAEALAPKQAEGFADSVVAEFDERTEKSKEGIATEFHPAVDLKFKAYREQFSARAVRIEAEMQRLAGREYLGSALGRLNKGAAELASTLPPDHPGKASALAEFEASVARAVEQSPLLSQDEREVEKARARAALQKNFVKNLSLQERSELDPGASFDSDQERARLIDWRARLDAIPPATLRGIARDSNVASAREQAEAGMVGIRAGAAEEKRAHADEANSDPVGDGSVGTEAAPSADLPSGEDANVTDRPTQESRVLSDEEIFNLRNKIYESKGFDFVDDPKGRFWVDGDGARPAPGTLREIFSGGLIDRAEDEHWSADRFVTVALQLKDDLPFDQQKNIEVASIVLRHFSLADGRANAAGSISDSEQTTTDASELDARSPQEPEQPHVSLIPPPQEVAGMEPSEYENKRFKYLSGDISPPPPKPGEFPEGPGSFLTPKGDNRKPEDYTEIWVSGINTSREEFQKIVDKNKVLGYYNPTVSVVDDVIEASTQKFDPSFDLYAPQLAAWANTLNGPIKIIAHSQGTLTVANAAIDYGMRLHPDSLLDFRSPAMSKNRAKEAALAAGGDKQISHAYVLPIVDVANLYSSFSTIRNPVRRLGAIIDIMTGFEGHAGTFPD